jgi:hypothetical protein
MEEEIIHKDRTSSGHAGVQKESRRQKQYMRDSNPQVVKEYNTNCT